MGNFLQFLDQVMKTPLKHTNEKYWFLCISQVVEFTNPLGIIGLQKLLLLFHSCLIYPPPCKYFGNKFPDQAPLK